MYSNMASSSFVVNDMVKPPTPASNQSSCSASISLPFPPQTHGPAIVRSIFPCSSGLALRIVFLFASLCLPLALVLSPALPLGPLLLITAAELGVVVVIALGHAIDREPRGSVGGPARRGRARGRAHVDEVACVLVGVLVALDEVAKFLVAGVDELEGGEAAFVLDARVGAGLEHHVDEVVAKGALGGGFGVEPADGGVQGGVALEAVDGVAFEVGLVEEVVDDVVWKRGVLFLVYLCGFVSLPGGGKHDEEDGDRGKGNTFRTVTAGGSLVVEVVAHDGCGFVEQLGDFGVGLVFEEFGQELDVVAPAGFDELLLDGGALVRKERKY